jgi:protein-S-isoprenylcysteine O-methyltransferase Ste14
MPSAVRSALLAISLTFLVVGMYHRIRAARAGDKLDRTKEGWPILIGIRVGGLATFGSTLLLIWKPSWFDWAALPISDAARWIGVVGFFLGVTWLIWMFISLGTNLTDTVVTRRDAHFVERGPYRYVRNPMYTGILMVGVSLGLALGTWLVPIAASAMFWMLAIRTRIEEGYLIARFGEQYRSYMGRVGRFFPRFT